MLRLMLAKQFLGASDIWRHFCIPAGESHSWWISPPTTLDGKAVNGQLGRTP